MLLGCGLPDYREIPKPVALTQPNATSLAFRTPSDVSIIQGYVLSYKIYATESEYASLDDESYFNESEYISNNTEMQPGNVIPRQRGFIKAGIDGKYNLNAYQIPDLGVANQNIFIDFDSGRTQAAMDDSSQLPIVGYTVYPIVTPQVTLARGVNDPDDTSSQKQFLSFVADWDFDQSGVGYSDADLFRRLNISSFSDTDVDSLVSFLIDNGELLNPIENELIIGFVLYAYGYDTSPPPTIVYSKPIYLGSIKYQNVGDYNRPYR